MAKRAPERASGHDDEDRAAFRAAVRDVTPLAAPPIDHLSKPRRRRRPLAVAAATMLDLDSAQPQDRPRSPPDRPGHRQGRSESAPEEVAPESLLSFQRAGVRPQTLRKLKRGLYPIEDELDLHGQSESEARTRLGMFLAHSRDQALRCVRIVHGKGHRSGGQGPVLKSAVNVWLRRHLDVLAFTSARPIDGGAGALYVLLRH